MTEIDAFDEWGIRALVTTRDDGSFSTSSDEPVSVVMQRWDALRGQLFGESSDGRLATADRGPHETPAVLGPHIRLEPVHLAKSDGEPLIRRCRAFVTLCHAAPL